MRPSVLALLLGAGVSAFVAAQEPVPPVSMPQFVPGSYLVRFGKRSFDLEEFRLAIRDGKSAAEVAEIVGRMDAAVLRDQAGFVQAIEQLGARVTRQWWIINGACVEGLDGDGLAILAKLPDVEVVERDELQYPTNNVARDNYHHEAVSANARFATNGQPVIGSGLSVAILDTGVNAQYGTGTTNQPHPAYFIGGDPLNTSGGGIAGSRLKAIYGVSGAGTEDQNGHGSHVSGSVASDYANYRGIAPGAWIVGIKISGTGTSGSASSSSLVSAWQTVASQRVAHNIKVANNSFSGSPSLTNSIQVALDNTAFNADVLACCAAGNNATNTSSSQNVWNGLAVGSLDKSTLGVSSYSCTGPLATFNRTYPDITCVGRDVSSIGIDTLVPPTYSGTSMASPMASGGGALLRQAVPTMSAIEAKALLLNTTKHTQNARNTYGLGMMDCDASVAAALAQDFVTVQMSSNVRTYSRTFSFASPRQKRITAVWMHPGGGTYDNIDMRVYDGATLVASDLNPRNSYEHVDFAAQANVTYRLELTWVGTAVRSTLDVAIAGVTDVPLVPPVINAISPGIAAQSSGALVMLDGVMDRIERIDVGGVAVTNFAQVSPSRVTFNLPIPMTIASAVPISVSNELYTSNTVTIQIGGTHPAQMSGLPIMVRGYAGTLNMVSDANWQILVLMSPQNSPSVLPGLVSLGIGANFTDLFNLGTVAMNANGYASTSVIFPTNVPAATYYFQGIAFDPAHIVAPFERTPVFPVSVQ